MTETKGMIHLRSTHSVPETLARLRDLLAKRGLTVACHVSHSDAAAGVGLTMRPTELLLFGNPKAGTPLMQTAPTLALDLPLKALVWEDADGVAWLSYNDVNYLGERHGITAGLASLTAAEPLFREAVRDASSAT